MSHLSRLATLVVLLLVTGRAAADDGLPVGFQRVRVATGFDAPTSLDFLPDGRMLVTELDGMVRVVDDGQVLPTPLIDLDADRSTVDRGLFRVRVDPDFATNGWVYFFWTTKQPRNRVARFTVTGDVADPASEWVVWESPNKAAIFHHGGSLAFDAAGFLFVGLGDQYVSENAQNLDVPYGSILRLHPDGSIPIDNPYVGHPTADPRIWCHGVRNPFRLSISPDDEVWVGDVGGNTTGSWEEINIARPDLNLGWPEQEGQHCYTECSGFTFPQWDYQHTDPEYFEEFPQGSITLGPFYDGEQFPEEYHDALFFADYSNGWIRTLTFDDHGFRHGPTEEVFHEGPHSGTVVDLAVGPEGSLYAVTIGWALVAEDDEPTIWRYDYTGDTNQSPVAVAQVSPTEGDEPLVVTLVGSASYDPDGGPGSLTYLWDLGDGQTSTQADLIHTYTTRGDYAVALTVSDGAREQTSDPQTVTVGHAPQPVITSPPVGFRYRAGQTVAFAGTAQDGEDGALPDSAFTWEVRLVHQGHTHGYWGPVSGMSQGSFDVRDQGHSPVDTWLQLRLTVEDSDGIRRTVERDLTPLRSRFRLETEPPGIPLFLDGEFAFTPRDVVSQVGFRHALEAPARIEVQGALYGFVRWSHGKAREHRFRAPPSNALPDAPLLMRAEYTRLPR